RPRGRTVHDFGIHPLAGQRGKQLGVGEPRHQPAPAIGKDARPYDQRACTRTPASLVSAGDALEAAAPQCALERPQPGVTPYNRPVRTAHRKGTPVRTSLTRGQLKPRVSIAAGARAPVSDARLPSPVAAGNGERSPRLTKTATRGQLERIRRRGA